MPKSMIIYEQEILTLLALPEAQRSHIFTALLCASVDKKLPGLDPMEAAVFGLIHAQIERAAGLSEKRRNSAKLRWENEQSGANCMQNNANLCNVDANAYTTTVTPTITETSTETITDTVTTTVSSLAPEETAKKRSNKKPKPAKIQFAEFVSMTNDEYTSLVAKVGEQGTKRCIEILDNYKGSSGKKYNSDYRAILNWVITRYEEERSKADNAFIRPANTVGNEVSKNPFINAVMDQKEG